MKPYTLGAMAGVFAFVLQLAIVAYPQLSDLGAKSSALAATAVFDGTSSWLVLATVAYYLLAGLASHTLPLLLATRVHLDLSRKGPPLLRRVLHQRGAHSLVLVVVLAAMVVANATYFPGSSAFPNRPLEVAVQAAPWSAWVLAGLLGVCFLYWLVLFAGRGARAVTALALLAGAAAWTMPTGNNSHAGANERNLPDIIIIGVDSLRPDHLATYGFPGPSLTPSIDRFVSGAVRYPNAYTPLARTFIGYMSILSGQYPIHHGARENLYPASKVNAGASVAHRLRDQGYQTVFGIDEARFANFDQTYGFDTVVSPSPGILDFGAGSFLDTVGTNLLQLLPYSDLFLPHVAGNRAAATIYRPRVHDRRLARAVRQRDSARPLFLVSHFCMAHVPFAPADPSLPIRAQPFEDSGIAYQSALRVADVQVAALLGTLRETGRLDNAVVFFLSDHGEGLGMDKDRWIRANGHPMPATFGHGMPALDMAQSRVVFAVQRFRNGLPTLVPDVRHTSVSLVDVAPTAVALAGLSINSEFDGMALLREDGNHAPVGSRPIFIESGMSGTSLQRANVDPTEVADQFSHLYRITVDHRFELTPDALPDLLKEKQRAVIFEEFGVSSSPAGQMGSSPCWLKLNLVTQQAECLPIESRDPVVARGRSVICNAFSEDETFQNTWCMTRRVN